MSVRSRLTLAVIAASLTACIHVYSPEVQQGNIVTPDMLEKLRPGMTKSQVRFVLGTPLISDAFHPNRWDYLYLFQKGVGAPTERRHVVVVFENDTMARIEGDVAATRESPPAKPDATPRQQPTPPGGAPTRPPTNDAGRAGAATPSDPL